MVELEPGAVKHQAVDHASVPHDHAGLCVLGDETWEENGLLLLVLGFFKLSKLQPDCLLDHRGYLGPNRDAGQTGRDAEGVLPANLECRQDEAQIGSQINIVPI